MSRTSLRLLTIALIGCAPLSTYGNGGPFVIKYPAGDPAAHGTLARIGPDLRPGREERLRVVKEDLKIAFSPSDEEAFRQVSPVSGSGRGAAAPVPDPYLPPVVHVTAAYTIENPTDSEISVDFGFPILRGIYIHPYSMTIRPQCEVKMDDQSIPSDVISNSAIYGIIRQQARKAIDDFIAADTRLSELVADVRKSILRQRAREVVAQTAKSCAVPMTAVAADPAMKDLLQSESDAKDPARQSAREKLAAYLSETLKWDAKLSALFVEYVSLDMGKGAALPWDHARQEMFNVSYELVSGNLGPLAGIGEQKATQLFIELARKFDPKTASSYEDVFAAWGGVVRESSCDMKTGQARPREISLDDKDMRTVNATTGNADPTIYARVRYLDEKFPMSPGERASCEAILKNLPVVFTFAPMNLLHYTAKFPAKSTHVLAVSYRQYAFLDTAEPRSYQAAYVLHPASFWKDFGPINLEVARPEGINVKATTDCKEAGVEEREQGRNREGQPYKAKVAVARATLTDKTGELFVGIDATEWDKQRKEAREARLKPMGGTPRPVQAAAK